MASYRVDRIHATIKQRQPLDVVTLTTSNFEHQTQASTGQTTGHWCVLFYNGTVITQQNMAAEDAWEQMAEEEDKRTIFAKIDGSTAKDLMERLKVETLPTIILFRDRQMFTFPKPIDSRAEVLVHEVMDFLSGGYAEQEGQLVPGVPDMMEMAFNFVSNLAVSTTAFMIAGGLLVVLGFGMAIFLYMEVSSLAKQAPSKPAPVNVGGTGADKAGSNSSKAEAQRLQPVVESPMKGKSAGPSPFGAAEVQQQEADEDSKGKKED